MSGSFWDVTTCSWQGGQPGQYWDVMTCSWQASPAPAPAVVRLDDAEGIASVPAQPTAATAPALAGSS